MSGGCRFTGLIVRQIRRPKWGLHSYRRLGHTWNLSRWAHAFFSACYRSVFRNHDPPHRVHAVVRASSSGRRSHGLHSLLGVHNRMWGVVVREKHGCRDWTRLKTAKNRVVWNGPTWCVGVAGFYTKRFFWFVWLTHDFFFGITDPSDTWTKVQLLREYRINVSVGPIARTNDVESHVLNAILRSSLLGTRNFYSSPLAWGGYTWSIDMYKCTI